MQLDNRYNRNSRQPQSLGNAKMPKINDHTLREYRDKMKAKKNTPINHVGEDTVRTIRTIENISINQGEGDAVRTMENTPNSHNAKHEDIDRSKSPVTEDSIYFSIENVPPENLSRKKDTKKKKGRNGSPFPVKKKSSPKNRYYEEVYKKRPWLRKLEQDSSLMEKIIKDEATLKRIENLLLNWGILEIIQDNDESKCVFKKVSKIDGELQKSETSTTQSIRPRQPLEIIVSKIKNFISKDNGKREIADICADKVSEYLNQESVDKDIQDMKGKYRSLLFRSFIEYIHKQQRGEGKDWNDEEARNELMGHLAEISSVFRYVSKLKQRGVKIEKIEISQEQLDEYGKVKTEFDAIITYKDNEGVDRVSFIEVKKSKSALQEKLADKKECQFSSYINACLESAQKSELVIMTYEDTLERDEKIKVRDILHSKAKPRNERKRDRFRIDFQGSIGKLDIKKSNQTTIL